MHRDGDKPAKIKIDPRTKVVTLEQYFLNGVEHRLSKDEPTRIRRDAKTGKITHKEWKREGLHHRDGGLPAVLNRDPKTDVIIYEAFYKNGDCYKEIHRDPKTGETYGNKNDVTLASVRKAVKRDLNL